MCTIAHPRGVRGGGVGGGRARGGGGPPPDIAKDFGVHEMTLHKWTVKHLREAARRPRGLHRLRDARKSDLCFDAEDIA